MPSPPSPPSPSPILRRVLADLPRLGAEVVARIAAEVPSFRSLPEDVLHVEIRTAVVDNLGLVLGALAEGRDLDTERLGRPLRQVMVRVEDRPLFADILRAYFIGVRVGWERIVDAAEPHEVGELHTFVAPLAFQLQRLFGAAAEAYLDEQLVRHGEVGEARRELAAALLAGRPAQALAERAGVAIGGAYVVLTWRMLPNDDDGSGDTTLLRRRIRGAVNDRFHATVLNVLEETGGTALVPAVDEGPPSVVQGLREVVGDLGRIVGRSVVGAAAVADTAAEMPEAAGEAREVLDVAVRLDRPAGLYLLDDLLLEVQLARPGVANTRLAHRLEPLRDREELLITLRAFVDARLNRRRAAAELHVHPNTLDYRLHRIAEFTGLDPTDPADLRVLSAALTVCDLRS